MIPRSPSNQEPAPLSTGAVDRFNFAIQFEKYRNMVLKRWWILALSISVAMVIGGWRAYRQPDLFMSVGRMMVKPQVNALPSVGSVYIEELNNFFGTQVLLMQSREVLGEAQAKLVELERSLPAPPAPVFNVVRMRDSNVFALSVSSTSPEYARRYLDAVMKEFIAYKKRMRTDVSENTASTLLREKEKLEQELRRVEEELYGFQKQNNMAYYEGQGNVAVQYLVELKRRQADVRTELDLLNAETAEQRIVRGVESPVMMGSTNAAPGAAGRDEGHSPQKLKIQSEYGSLKNAIALLKAERDALGKFLKPKHPKMMAINEEIDRREQLLKMALRQTQDEIDAYRQSLIKQQEALIKNIAEWDKSALEANQKASEYNHLKANVARIKELHEVLVKRLNEINVGTGLDQETIQISESASQAFLIGPRRSKVLLMSGLAGLALAMCVIVILDKLDDRVRNVEDLQSSVAETVLGQVPAAEEGGDGKRQLIDLAVHNTFSEAFRNIRSSLMFSPVASGARVIAVTSAIPGDGKTTCAANLSVCLSQVESGRTLLIDADMRRMSIHRHFNIANERGLSDVLSGQASLEDCIVNSGLENLDILCAGAVPPSPGELILSENFRLLLETVRNGYDRVILDTSPVLAMDDPLSMAPLVDGVVMVVKANQTSMRYVQKSLDLLKQRGARIFGIILNGIDVNSAHYYYFYYYSNYYQSASAQKSSRHARPRTLREAAREAEEKRKKSGDGHGAE
ncbi:MAG: polysaccharide biosynthesis tyrosine autokinase [Verrucomicrobiae bacterium]|nr:polysaccharide biosynthesis tyrosine autokinase [Verrucomicrobiae bacterium]